MEDRKNNILVLSNSSNGLYSFRREVMEALAKRGTVYISAPSGNHDDYWQTIGCVFLPCEVDRRGTNPLNDLRLLKMYRRLLKQYCPAICFTYTIKPNIYGGMACAWSKVPCAANVTGLGDAMENAGLLQKLTIRLYRYGLRKDKTVFFQNRHNLDFFINNHIYNGNAVLIPGSGVNLEQHKLEPYPKADPDGRLTLVVVGRISKDKGICEILEAAKELKDSSIRIRLIGSCEEDYFAQIRQAETEGVIQYLGYQTNVHEWLASSHGILHASYHEGMSNVLLEAASAGRPILATAVPGCLETFEEGVTGFSFPPRNSDAIVQTVKRFAALSYDERRRMGELGRKKMENEFDRQSIVRTYLSEI